jgi:hypothetical protein
MARSGPRKLPEIPDHLRQYASQPGCVVCLRCQGTFYSPDRVRIRTCDKCAKEADRLANVREVNESIFHTRNGYGPEGVP